MSQAFKKRLGPGVWEDEDGAMHFSLPELCEHLGLDYNERNKDEVERAIRELMKAEAPDAVCETRQDICPFCALTGWEHLETCPIGTSGKLQ